ncbi:hypothetical protein AZE42_12060 [Rhizopogon vesiculosus]|uniref:Uncharacterized protein n=1 Tax=Rhizopogon vesiculosus TaxID=180088 RepID=A0A1J8Q8U8_9AGAM|nr:hypothetical protein AZE42_12060 [Rhizopogon vesiculosus]
MNVMSSGMEVVLGHLNNLGDHVQRNTKKTRISKERKAEKENVQPVQPTRIGPNLAGIPFLNSAFSPHQEKWFKVIFT